MSTNFLTIRQVRGFEWLTLLAICLCLGSLLLSAIYLQNRILNQVNVIVGLGLEKTIIGQLVMHPGRHTMAPGFRSDPMEWVLSDEGLNKLRQITGVAEVAGFEKRSEILKFPHSTTREKYQVMVVPPNFFLLTGLAGDNAEESIARGETIIPVQLAKRLQLSDETDALFEIENPDNSAIPTSQSPVEVQAIAKTENIETKIRVLPIKIPEGMDGFENTIFIGLSHRIRKDMSMIMPMPYLWIRLHDGIDTKISTHAVRDYLQNEAPRVFDNAHIEVQNLGELMAGKMDINALAKIQTYVLIGALLALLALVTAMAFLNWGKLLRELSLRQALGQSRRFAVFKSSQTILIRMSIGVVAGMLLALIIGIMTCHPPLSLVGKQTLLVGLMACFALSCLIVFSWMASYREPIRVLNTGIG